MSVVFRVDASVEIGTGHVARCLTLAKALSHLQVTFICRNAPGNMVGFIRAQGVKVLELPAAYSSGSASPIEAVFDANVQHDEASECLQLLGEHPYSLLVVDHYRLDATFSQKMRQKCQYIMVIDDLANRVHDADILLDQNLLPAFESRYQELVSERTITLLGPQYALLREEFYQSYPIENDITSHSLTSCKYSILVFFGGSDADNVTCKALSGIRLLADKGAFDQLDVDVVLGGSNPWKEQLYIQYADCSYIHWHVECDYMAKLMAKATLALGAGGSTHWERCMMGLASLVVTVADNQVECTQYLAGKGACQWLGHGKDVSSVDIAKAIESWLSLPEKLIEMSQRASQIVSHDCGVPKVLQALELQLLLPVKGEQ
ncbi:UDP-2,4-diacetamido-2,4,6-trideoxy-beta-L-altropyranose hydrolase [Shewanella baltica]|uniref:UDP-2,4-diacetamido-2,4, 6-trideoxy-beta-L-altropyranose hydrolase n=1 Tax=Shewanella baltica TaxID=62322 RepID=UPI0024BA493B|nr:UDP-2,4-diacetamido-2,4,6-trideoxy-beta-L-altropyranose hydrolase [Shewanella baltica]